jgi:hypothetical protein
LTEAQRTRVADFIAAQSFRTEVPERFPHPINPFLNKSIIVGYDEEDRRAQFLDIHSAPLAMSPEEIRMFREKGVGIYDWQAQDPLATVLLMPLGAYPDAAEFGIDYKNVLTQAVQPEELILLPDRPLFADILERPTISYLPRYRMRRHYTTPAGWDGRDSMSTMRATSTISSPIGIVGHRISHCGLSIPTTSIAMRN